jgi:two-component system response regulator GlrR
MSAPKRIVIVDDDPGLLRLLRLRLTVAGYEALTMESADTAFAYILIHPPHLVITDFSMHGMDGIALCKAIHQHYPLLPVIMLTAHYSSSHAITSQQHGIFSVLPKPFNSQSLLDQITCALNVGTPLYEDEAPDSPVSSFK